MKLLNIMQHVYCEPWVILPAMHKQISDIVSDHLSGDAHLPDGRAETFINSKPPEKSGLKVSDGVAYIDLFGVVGRRVGEFEKSSGVTDLIDFENAMNEAAVRDDVQGILLSIDSPGGTVGGTPEAAALVKKVNTSKPVVAYTDSLMASAAYWIGSQAAMIVASGSSQVGSIGVYQAFLDQSRQAELEGVKVELFKTGKYKGMGIAGLPLTDEQRALIQSGVDEVFSWFVDAVTDQHDIPADALQGQTFFAQDALVNDLIDTIGGELDAREELAVMMRQKKQRSMI